MGANREGVFFTIQNYRFVPMQSGEIHWIVALASHRF
jgi:hypothetical protein